MIVRIQGRLEQVGNGQAIITVDSLSYQVFIPEMTVRRLEGELGRSVTLHTLYYLQGYVGGALQPTLVGFETETDREFFQLLITVDGLGPKAVLKMLTEPVAAIASAIERGDEDFLQKLPGLGRQRSRSVIAKLRGKAAAFAAADLGEAKTDGAATAIAGARTNDVDEVGAEVLAVLLQLGYSEREAEAMLQQARSRRPDLLDPGALVQEVFAPARANEARS